MSQIYEITERRFQDLPVGASFIVPDSYTARGPWVKESRTRYTHHSEVDIKGNPLSFETYINFPVEEVQQ